MLKAINYGVASKADTATNHKNRLVAGVGGISKFIDIGTLSGCIVGCSDTRFFDEKAFRAEFLHALADQDSGRRCTAGHRTMLS